MKKIIICTILFLALAGGIAGWIYSNATSPIRAAEQKAFQLAGEEAGMIKTDRFYLYNGNETVYVVKGTNKKGQEIIAWIPQKGGEAVVRKLGDGVTKSQAMNKVQNEKHPKKIISVRPGMEKGVPFWEVYYTSGNGLLNYYYVHFDTGEMYKLIENL
ncbi:cell wall elongation regulator TseB-like domain-containing protein [Bacillus sp. FJAT-27245]|uniref:cell wall elongation regulator TseB-like domain-containing protein n=1 Tax=Bacillus sp. FJAT-27245 TaxID=1684144 RepID=UPI0006A78FC6|nr:DUF5590 domain-containing protein [Bacillus sp. FJAT-27245]